MSISYVICAAGKGQRFSEAGISKPKPLIQLKGKTMLERSLDSLAVGPADQVIVISQERDKLPAAFEHLSQVTWFEIDGHTNGQLDTFLLGAHLVRHEQVVIFNCDTYFTSPSLAATLGQPNVTGIIPCSIQPGNAWSFCQVDENLDVIRVAEKDRISDWASVGYYYFKGRDLLLSLAEAEAKSRSGVESFVAPIYNRYLQRGHQIKVTPVEKFLPFGTPDQVKDYWHVSLEELLKENQ